MRTLSGVDVAQVSDTTGDASSTEAGKQKVDNMWILVYRPGTGKGLQL